MSTLSESIHEFVREGFSHEFGKPAIDVKPDEVWARFSEIGTHLWLDTGDIEEATGMWNTSFEALTTNNSLLNKEIQKGIYDSLIPQAASVIREAKPDIDERTLILEVAFALNAYHGLRLVEQFDAKVSVELHTDLAHDVERTVAYGKRYFAICPERFYVKVPLTAAGYLGARKLAQAGIPINFTLGFSARQNYVAALLTQPAYVNVFMGRLNAFVINHHLGDGENVGEKTTLATQRELLNLRKAGRSNTMLIGASIREGSQITDLAGVDVFTMPPKAAAQFRADPPAHLVSQVDTDPDVTLAEGIELDDFGGGSLWAVTDSFKACVESLLNKDMDALTPGDVQAHFRDAGMPGFLPHWSEQDTDTVKQDGKIPGYDNWKDRLAAREVGLDALMNLSAFYAFSKDQKALDDRIKSLLDSYPPNS